MTSRIVLRSFQSPGDIVMLSAAVRDLHKAYPGRFATDVRTSADAIWEHNPYLTPLDEHDTDVHVLDMHYPLIHQSNQRPYHFLHGYAQYLEQQLDLKIPITRFAGDIHLSNEERTSACPGGECGVPERFWIIIAGGKHDFTAKWWNPAAYQKVVDHFQESITFVQCGESGHWHPRLENVVDLVGKTTLREFIRLMRHADGVLCPVTLAMHLAASVETKPGHPPIRPCVVVAGGREPAHWEAYPNHQFISTNGTLPCCSHGGCWKSRCQLVGDGDAKDSHNVCELPVHVREDLRIPKCMEMITPEEVIRRIELYHDGGLLRYQPHGIQPQITTQIEPVQQEVSAVAHGENRQSVLLRFRHGLGDAAQLTGVLSHLRHYHPEWDIDVAALVGKHTCFNELCNRVLILDNDPPAETYDRVFDLSWDEARQGWSQWPSTKLSRCLIDVFGCDPIPELCRYRVAVSAEARLQAGEYLRSLCAADPDPDGRYPVVLIHYEGNTSAERKNIPEDVVRAVCDVVRAANAVPVILDWDRRSSLVDGQTIFNPGADHPLWGGTGTGDAEMLAALIDSSQLMIGVDSGPLHVAGATTTPTIGVWTQHHPVHYFDLADNVMHLVPGNHRELVNDKDALRFFESSYRHQTYRQLSVDLPALVTSRLSGIPFDQAANRMYLKKLTATSYAENYYVEHKLAGLDYLGFGQWQQEYGRWLTDSLGWKGKTVLDVGCACGAVLRGLGQAGAIVQGVDINEHMIQLGRQQWPDMAPLLHVCDAVNLHLFGDGIWDAIHCAQVAEHWKPELVPHILRELARVVAPGGRFFCALDTEELLDRNDRAMDDEDPTHVCIRPMTWWHEQLAANGWRVCTEEVRAAVEDHPESFLRRYDWDWFVAEKVAS